MTQRDRLTVAPQAGEYLTDGESLFEVTGEMDSDGNYYLLDCALPVGKDAQPIKVSTHELWKGYWVVQP
jgi:hypothetical protein